jgi:surface carbohydrate biosynthesis protein
MSAPRIALVVDHPARDLPGLVLTAVELCRRGAVCHLVPANLAWREIWSLAPDLTVLNYFRRSNESLGRALAEAGLAFGVLDTEGGVWPDPASYTELLWTDRDLLHEAACVCLWGERLAAHLLDQEIFLPSQVRVTGCPRFDFYSPAWRPVLTPADKPDGNGRPRVLINTNFSTRNPRFATVEKKIETSRRNFGWSEERIQQILEVEEEALGAVIRLTGRLAKDFPGADILLRPHPFEGLDWYRRELARHENVTVDGDGPVQPAILRAAVVIQRSCTTGIEAGLAGTPTLSPQWVPAPFLMPAAEAVSVACSSYEMLAGEVEAVVEGRYRATSAVQAAIEQVTRDWFCSADGMAHHRVADALFAGLGSRGAAQLACRRNLYRFDLSGEPLSGTAAIGARLREALHLSPEWSFHSLRTVRPDWWTSTSKFFDPPMVQALADRMTASLRRESSGACDVRAELGRERGDCRHGHLGYSVTLSPMHRES